MKTRRRRPEFAADSEGHVPEHAGPPDSRYGQNAGHDPGCAICGHRRLAGHRGLSVADFSALALQMMDS